jgi:hypothetical protein
MSIMLAFSFRRTCREMSVGAEGGAVQVADPSRAVHVPQHQRSWLYFHRQGCSSGFAVTLTPPGAGPVVTALWAVCFIRLTPLTPNALALLLLLPTLIGTAPYPAPSLYHHYLRWPIHLS